MSRSETWYMFGSKKALLIGTQVFTSFSSFSKYELLLPIRMLVSRIRVLLLPSPIFVHDAFANRKVRS